MEVLNTAVNQRPDGNLLVPDLMTVLPGKNLVNPPGTGLPGEERKNPFAALSAKPKGNASGKRPVNPFASFFSGPYGNDSTAPKPSFTFNFGIPKTQRILNHIFDFKEPVSFISIELACPPDVQKTGDLEVLISIMEAKS